MKKLSSKNKAYVKHCIYNCYDEYVRKNGKPNKINLEYFLMGLYEHVLGIGGRAAADLVIGGRKT